MLSLAGCCTSALQVPFPSCTCYNQPSCLNASFLPVHTSEKAKPHLRLQSGTRRDDGSKLLLLRIGRVRASSSDENLDPPSANLTTTTPESDKDLLAAKLAAVEAEAEALKKELALRRAGPRDGDLSKLKITTPERRIDGTGYREQLFSGPGAKKEPKKWGITEAELFLSKGAPTEGSGLGGAAMETGADAIITRRLVVGLGLTAVALALAFIKLPVILTKPSKPLFFYLTYILRLKDQLEILEATSSDAKYAETQLQRSLGSAEELKENFLSATALLDGPDADRASQLAYEIFGYLSQVDYSKYFENLGEPTSTQQVEFLKFSLQSIKAAGLKIQKFLTLFPSEALTAAQIANVSII